MEVKCSGQEPGSRFKIFTWSRIYDTLNFSWMLVFQIYVLYLLILQRLYSSNRCYNSIKNDQSMECITKNKLEDSLAHLSTIEPDLKLSSTLLYATYVALVLAHLLVTIKQDKSKTNFEIYLVDRPEYERITNDQFENLLDELIISNRNFVRTIRDHYWREDLPEIIHYGSNKTICKLIIEGHNLQQESRFVFRPPLRTYALRIGQENDSFRNHNNQAIEGGEFSMQMQILDDQLVYLEHLKEHTKLLWPKTRNPEYVATLKLLWRFIYFQTGVLSFVCILYWTSSLMLKNKLYRLERNIEREPSTGRAIFTMFIFFTPHITHNQIVMESLRIFVQMMDLLRLNNQLSTSIGQLLNEIGWLRSHLSINKSDEAKLEEMALRANCDRLALISYVKLRYIVDQVGPVLRLCSRLALKMLVPSVTALLIASFSKFNKEMFDVEVSVSSPLVISVGFALNLSLSALVYASRCFQRTFEKSTSIFSYLIEDPGPPSSEQIIDETNLDAKPGIDDTDNGGRKSLVSMHTSELWFRLVSDERISQTKLSIPLFKPIKLDYRFLMQLNIIASSFCMLTFIYRN